MSLTEYDSLKRRRPESISDSLVLAKKNELIASLEPYVVELFPSLLPPKDKLWTPADCLPDISASSPDWPDKLKTFRQQEGRISPELLNIIIVSGATEEALPSYQTRLNSLDPIRDVTGTDDSAWARSAREWTAQEYPHGKVLMDYLLLDGRADMAAVQRTNQALIRNGFNMRLNRDPYKFFIYTTFQERATQIVHARSASQAKKEGGETLAIICATLSPDEGRHYLYYGKIVRRIFELDPDGAMVALNEMMQQRIIMPTERIDDGTNNPTSTFERYGRLVDNIGIYTPEVYADVFNTVLDMWDVRDINPKEDAAKRAQEGVIRLSERHTKVAANLAKREKPALDLSTFTWLKTLPEERPALPESALLFERQPTQRPQ